MCCGIHFTTPGAGGSAVPLVKKAIANGELFRAHAFELACARNDINHRTTKRKHPWTNGQVERRQLREHLANFLSPGPCPASFTDN